MYRKRRLESNKVRIRILCGNKLRTQLGITGITSY